MLGLKLNSHLPQRILIPITSCLSGKNNKLCWLRILVVSGTLMLCLSLSIYPSLKVLAIFLGIICCLWAALLILRWPTIGLAVLIVASLVVPFSIGTGTQSTLNPTVLLLPVLIGLSLLGRLASPKKKQLTLSKPILAGIVFIFFVLLSFLYNNLIHSPDLNAPILAQIGQLAIFVLSISAFILMAQQVGNLKWLERLTWLFVGLGGIFIAASLMPMLGNILLPLFSRGSMGSIFWTWLVAISFSQAVFNKELRKGLRVVLAILCMSTLYLGLVIHQSWASGWLPPIVAILAIIWFDRPRLGLPATLIGGVIILLNYQTVLDLILINEQYSYITRAAAWRSVLEIAMVNPIIGLGPANYYWNTEFTPILGWFVRFSSHNQYIDIFAQIGLLGLGCFAWFVWEVGKLCLRLRARVPDGFPSAYVYAVFGGLAGTLVAGMLSDWIFPFVYNITLEGMRSSVMAWLFMGGLVSLERILKQQEQRVVKA